MSGHQMTCTDRGPCAFHADGAPPEEKCPGYCCVTDCQELVACEDAEDGMCHAHAAVWHAQEAGIGESVPSYVDPASPGQAVEKVSSLDRAAIEEAAARRLEAFVREVYAMFGWQGGTVHQLAAEVKRLRRADAAASEVAQLMWHAEGRPWGSVQARSAIVRAAEVLREFRPRDNG